MRTIKFRAWHKQEKQMYHPQYLHFSPDGELFGILVKEGQLLAIDDFELMWFIGVKDKHGDEVYEDDVIKLGVGAAYDPILFRVVWDENQLKYMARQIDHKEELMINIMHFQHDIEIQGNIYEHPQLARPDWWRQGGE